MGLVLNFELIRRQPTTTLSGGAEIVIFPGVRYERWTGKEPPPRRANPAKISVKRRKRRRKDPQSAGGSSLSG
jgi:hypothetical protein